MASRAIAKRYAEAIFDLASEEDRRDAWQEDLNRLALAANDEVASVFFASPNVEPEQKVAVLEEYLPGSADTEVRNLARILISRRRFEAMPQIAAIFRDMVLEARGIAIAEVTTAIELTDDEMQSITSRLEGLIGQQLEVRPKVDPDIIGGFIARIGDQLVDGSVRSQLRNMRAALAQR